MRGRIVALHLVRGGLLSEDEGDRDGVDGKAVGAEQRGEFGGGRIRSRIVCEADGVGRVHVREAFAEDLGGGRRAGPGGRVLDGGRGGGAVHGGEGRISSVADPGALDVDQAGAELGVADADRQSTRLNTTHVKTSY